MGPLLRDGERRSRSAPALHPKTYRSPPLRLSLLYSRKYAPQNVTMPKAPISVSSSAEAVATAEVSDGTVTVHPLAAGSATITVTMAATGNYTTASDTIAVTVAEPTPPDDGEG